MYMHDYYLFNQIKWIKYRYLILIKKSIENRISSCKIENRLWINNYPSLKAGQLVNKFSIKDKTKRNKLTIYSSIMRMMIIKRGERKRSNPLFNILSLMGFKCAVVDRNQRNCN